MNHRENFVKLIEKISEKTGGNSQVFNDFLKIAATSLNSFNNNPTREKSFQETMNKYDEKIQPLFKGMLAELTLTLNDCVKENPHYEDILGKIFHEMNLNERKNGQVFTPQHTGDLMGEVALPEDYVKSEIQRQGFITIKEPCCGSGAITLGALNRLLKLGVSPNFQVVVYASDIDERCVFMSYIQLSLYCIPAVVTQQNAITDEKYSDSWYTPIFYLNNLRRKVG